MSEFLKVICLNLSILLLLLLLLPTLQLTALESPHTAGVVSPGVQYPIPLGYNFLPPRSIQSVLMSVHSKFKIATILG